MYYNILIVNKINNSRGGVSTASKTSVCAIQGRAKRLGLGFFLSPFAKGVPEGRGIQQTRFALASLGANLYLPAGVRGIPLAPFQRGTSEALNL